MISYVLDKGNVCIQIPMTYGNSKDIKALNTKHRIILFFSAMQKSNRTPTMCYDIFVFID
jgi:hypothetical protein